MDHTIFFTFCCINFINLLFKPFFILIIKLIIRFKSFYKTYLKILIFFSIALIALSRFNFPAINYLKISLNEIIYRASFVVSIPEQQIQNASIALNKHWNTFRALGISYLAIAKYELAINSFRTSINHREHWTYSTFNHRR